MQAGAGVVADSVPTLEYEETVNKSKGVLRALGLAAGLKS
jgi:anthranilate synthase component 1